MVTNALTFSRLLYQARSCKRAGMDKGARRLWLHGFKTGARFGFGHGMQHLWDAVKARRSITYMPGTPGYALMNERRLCLSCRWSGIRQSCLQRANDALQTVDALCPVCRTATIKAGG